MTSLHDIGEQGLLESLLPYLQASGGEVLVGAGEDDAAAWREGDGTITVATCDTMVEQVHFDRTWLDPEDVGWRAIALAAGDLAAKGATPRYGLVSVSLPESWSREDAVALYRGLAAIAAEIGLKIVGGDTTASPHLAVLGVTLLGTASSDVLPRASARAGWSVAVTGRLGAAAAGLRELTHGEPCPPDWEAALRRPLPRIAEGQILARHGLCCGDVSDGLYREMEKFLAAAGVGAVIHADRVPRVRGTTVEQALASGEEVELVCTGPEAGIAEAAAELECGLTTVGELTEEPTVVVLDERGQRLSLADRGYEHFA
jgi:thiamine-monophosphate kinase